MTDPVIPLLSKGPEDLVESKQGILWHIVSFSLLNPGFTSDINEEEMISFRVLEAEYGADSEALRIQYADALTEVANRHFPNDGITAIVEVGDVAENTFTLKVGFVDANQELLLSTKPITVTPDNVDLDLNKVARD